MAVDLVIARQAENDLAAAYAWYENRRFGLGEDFLSSVDASIRRICRTPELYARIHENYRRALVRRFPYAIFYEYDAGTVSVYGVFHTAQDPQKWQHRLP